MTEVARTNNRFVMSRRVEFADTDMAGIVHFTAYFRYMETAEHEMFRSLGLSLIDTETDPSLGWPRVSCGFDFLRSLRYRDSFEVYIGVAQMSRSSITYEADIVRDGQTLARGHSTSACCAMSSGQDLRPIPIPQEIRMKLEQYLVATPRAKSNQSNRTKEDRSV